MSAKQKKYTLESIQIETVAEAAAFYTPFSRARIARSGVSPLFVQNLMDVFAFKKQETASLIDISPKTLDRHLKDGKPFSGLQADRLLELAELFQMGKEVFGNENKFLKWMNSKIAAFKNTSPRQWLDTQLGIKAIMNELGRIQHGIFA